MKRELMIRCKCNQCKRTALVKIGEYLVTAGPKCFHKSLTQSPCLGTLLIYSDDWEDSALNAAALLHFLRNEQFHTPNLGELVDEIADDFGAWAEGQQSPEEMGWVGQDGRP